MRTEYWKKESRAEASKLLASLTDDVESHNWLHAPIYELQMRGLAAKISRAWASGPIRWDVLRHAINSCIESKKTTLADLEDELDKMWDLSQRSKSTNKRSYRVLIAAELASGPGITFPLTVESHGRRFDIRQFVSPEECFGKPIESLDPFTQHRVDGNYPPAYASLNVEASSAHLAIDEALDAYTLWRSVLNFATSLYSFQVQFAPGSRADIPPPRWVACLSMEDDCSPVMYGGMPFHHPERPPMEVSANHHVLAASLLKPLIGDVPESSTIGLLVDAYRLFGLAMDQDVWHQTLLVFWQLAEHLTVIDGAKEKHDEICKRLPLMQSPQSIFDPTLTAVALRDIMQIRHGIVHRGSFSSAFDSDISFLKGRCVEAIFWLAQRHQDLPDVEHLKVYFQYAHATQKQIVRVQHVLAQLQQSTEAGT